jgi:uncharacterized membrane protein
VEEAEAGVGHVLANEVGRLGDGEEVLGVAGLGAAEGADFAGGLSSRRIGAYRAVFYCETVGIVLLLSAIPFVKEPAASGKDLLLALCAGLIGSFSLMLLYKAMIHGKMSIAMPVSAVLAAALPIFIGIFTEGFPGAAQLIGFVLALAAVILISQENDSKPQLQRFADLRLPLLSGLGIGLYFVLLHQAVLEQVVVHADDGDLESALIELHVLEVALEGETENEKPIGIALAAGFLDGMHAKIQFDSGIDCAIP